MSAAPTLRTLGQDYKRLPDLLSPAGGAGDLSGIRTRHVYSPAPIDLGVSDLIRDINLYAASWEFELCLAFMLPTPYWTRPTRQAVPLSLVWSAGIIDRPPTLTDQYGFEYPGTVPDRLAVWIEEAATTLTRRCRAALGIPGRVTRATNSCPSCGKSTLMTYEGQSRCVAAGCSYQTPAAA